MLLTDTDPAAIAMAEPIRKSAWGQIMLLALILFGAAMMLAVFGPLQEAAKTDMKLSDFSVSLIQGLMTGAPAAIVAVPISWLIDHGARVRLLTCLIALCVAGALWTAFAGGFVTLSAARMLEAVGAGCAVAVIISLSADLVAPDHRGRAIVLLGLGTAAGGAAAFVIGGALLHDLAAHPAAILGSLAPWRATHLVVGTVGAILLFPLFFLREPLRHEVEETQASLGVAFHALWAKRRFLIPLFTGQLAVGMADTAAGIWAAPVLIRDFHLQPFQFAGWVGGVIFIGGVAGSALGGLAADWGQKTGRRGGLLIPAVAATLVGVPAALFPVMHNLLGFQVLFTLLLFSGMVTAVVSSTAVTVLIPNEERGACMAAFGVISSLVGKSLAPLIVTLGSAAMGGERHLGAALAATGVATGVLSFLGYVMAMRNAPPPAAELT
jgi:MFS family permease